MSILGKLDHFLRPLSAHPCPPPTIHLPICPLDHLYICPSSGNIFRAVSMCLILSGALRVLSLRPSLSFGKNRHVETSSQSVLACICASIQDHSEGRIKNSLKLLFASSLYPIQESLASADTSNYILVKQKNKLTNR